MLSSTPVPGSLNQMHLEQTPTTSLAQDQATCALLIRVRRSCGVRHCIAVRPAKSAVCPRVLLKPLDGKPLGAALRLPGSDTATSCLLGSNSTCFLSAHATQTWKHVPYGPLQAAKARVTRAADAALPVQAKRFLATPSFDALALAFAQHAASRFEAAALAEVCCQTSPPAPLHRSSKPHIGSPSKHCQTTVSCLYPGGAQTATSVSLRCQRV